MKEQLNKYKKLVKEMIKDLKTKGNRHKQIPNILTTLRLFAPLVIIPAFVLSNLPLAFVSIIVFSLTDAADGFIARTFKLTSELGRDLDAIADKVFAGTLLISLCTLNPVYLISLILEVAIGSTCAYKKAHNIDMRTCVIGKIKTIILDILVILGIGSIFINIPDIILSVMVSLTATLQVITLKEYIVYKEPEKVNENEIIQEHKKIEEPEPSEEHVNKKTLTISQNYTKENEKQKTYVKTRFKK